MPGARSAIIARRYLRRNPTTTPKGAVEIFIDHDNWVEHAECRDEDPLKFEYDPEGYPDKAWPEWQADIEYAIDVCMGCPVLVHCKKSASNPDRDHTVRGGLQPRNYTRAERALNDDDMIDC